MKLVDNWRAAPRMLSVQLMALALALQAAGGALPPEVLATLPEGAQRWITLVLLAAGILARVLQQPSLHEPPLAAPQPPDALVFPRVDSARTPLDEDDPP